MAKYIEIEGEHINYPIGSDIDSVKKITQSYKRGFKALKYPKGSKFNLWCRGNSGSMLAIAFALLLPQYKWEIFHVKKPGEQSHSSFLVPGIGDNVIIDDFISSGETVDAILEKIKFHSKTPKILIVMGMSHYERFSTVFETIICSNLPKNKNNE